MTLSVHFLTLGCPKNEVDSDRMAASLSGAFEIASDPDQADVIVVNTCSFIQEATEESIDTVLQAVRWRGEGTGRRVVVAGCMPSRYGPDLAESLPEVDAFVPVADEATLREVLADLLDADLPAETQTPCRLSAGESAYLQISDGCHRKCTYCTIPRIRGAYRSRTADDLAAEASLLVRNGARELVLIGQDTAAWGRDLRGGGALAELVKRLARTEGLAWLRLMYVQPDGVTPELLEVMAEEARVCHYLDIPLQHASRDVLHRMGRKGSGAEYLRLIGVVRAFLPDISLRTTLMAGFPGETEHDVEQLEAFLGDASFDHVGVFPFSPEEGTAAEWMPDQIPRDVRLERAQRLRDVADSVGHAVAAGHAGKTLEVLSEGSDDEGAPVGRHRGQAPDVDGVVFLDRPVPRGRIVEVAITGSVGYDLIGEVK